MSDEQMLAKVLSELDGHPIASGDGGDSAVYLLQGGVRHWITSPDVLTRMGFAADDVRRVAERLLKVIPTGEPIGENLRQILRCKVVNEFLGGRGIELGGGVAPHQGPPGTVIEQFDKRSVSELAAYFQSAPNQFQPTFSLDELPKRFPQGADFVIAHHVLEHCSDPLGALVGWNALVRNGGTVAISVPHVDHCPDKGRLVPPLEHLVMDHLLDRGDDAFESREHIYSFLMGWCDDGFGKGIDKRELARKAHQCASSPVNDLHWHAYRPQLLVQLIDAAAIFSHCRAQMLAVAGPDDAEGLCRQRAEGEILCVYRLERLPEHVPARSGAAAETVRLVESKLSRALVKLQRATTRGARPG